MPRLPDFFIVGANKGGTTSLAHYLAEHPQVFMPSVKEPTYFTLNTRRDSDLGERLPWRDRLIDSWEDYTDLFADAGDARAVGEASTAYLTTPEAPAAIHRAVPDARIIAVLRDPVERAYSHYQMYRRMGTDPHEDFEAALAGDLGPLYLEMGLYGAGLQRYRDLFPAANFRVYPIEQLDAHPAELLADLFAFLGVDPTFQPDTSQRLNTAERVPGLAGLIGSPVIQAVKATVPGSVRRRLRLALARLNRRPTQIRDETRHRLADHFRDDLALLDRLTGGSYSTWLDR